MTKRSLFSALRFAHTHFVPLPSFHVGSELQVGYACTCISDCAWLYSTLYNVLLVVFPHIPPHPPTHPHIHCISTSHLPHTLSPSHPHIHTLPMLTPSLSPHTPSPHLTHAHPHNTTAYSQGSPHLPFSNSPIPKPRSFPSHPLPSPPHLLTPTAG